MLSEPVAIDAQIFSSALLGLFELPFHQFRFLVGVGPTLSVARVTAELSDRPGLFPECRACWAPD